MVRLLLIYIDEDGFGLDLDLDSKPNSFIVLWRKFHVEQTRTRTGIGVRGHTRVRLWQCVFYPDSMRSEPLANINRHSIKQHKTFLDS